jgi:hypothetical protein
LGQKKKNKSHRYGAVGRNKDQRKKLNRDTRRGAKRLLTVGKFDLPKEEKFTNEESEWVD